MKKSDFDQMLITYGSNIRRLRKKKRMTMEQLAFETDIEYRQIGRIERGETNFTVLTLLRLAQVLEVDICEFFHSAETK